MGKKRHGGANFESVTEGQIIRLQIPNTANINPNIGGYRALTFAIKLDTKKVDIQLFRFTCFSDGWQPGDAVLCRMKLGKRSMLNHQPQFYIRCDETQATSPSHRLGLVNSDKEFNTYRHQPGSIGYKFPRKNQIGGVVLVAIPQT
jgi:hypothetical protein